MKPKRWIHRLGAAVLVACTLGQAPAVHAGLEPATPEVAPDWTEAVLRPIEQLSPPTGGNDPTGTARGLKATGLLGEPHLAAGAISVGVAAAGHGTPSLWALITTVRAQQSGAPLEVLESNLATARLLQPEAVAPVPLPAGLWLLLMGLLGWLGTALRVGRTQHLVAPRARSSIGA